MSTTQPSPSSLVADATTVANVVGVDQSPADIGGNGGVLTEPPVTSLAEANAGAVTGAVNALADSQRVAGIRQSDIDVGGNITVRGQMFADTIATSFTTSGDATSNANLGGPDFGGEALDAVGGIVNAEGSVIGGGSGSVIGSAGASFFSGPSAASAATVQDLPARAAELLQPSTGQLQAADAAFGLNLTIAAAETTTGEAKAKSLMPSQYGINLDTLTIGGAGEVAGGSFAGQAALASTIAGNATADVSNREVKGVSVDHLSIGSNGALIGEAEALGAALASSVKGDSNAFAGGLLVDGLPEGVSLTRQTVIGLDLPSSRVTGSPTHVGGNLELQANALLGKFTQATTTTGDASASATGASLDQSADTLVGGLVGGLNGGANGIGGFEATGVLAAFAGASTTTGDATALNGNERFQSGSALLPIQQINVSGMDALRSASDPPMLSLGGDLRNGGLFEGQLFLGSDAETTTGTALASNAGRVYGSSNLDVAIGGGVVSVDGSGQQSNATAAFNASGSAFTEASTVAAPVGDALGALAKTLLQGAGFSGSPVAIGRVITVGGNGDLSFASELGAVTSASAVMAGPADALLVGDPVGVVAESELRSAGYAASLSIAGSGNIDASSTVQSQTSARNTKGDAKAVSQNLSTGGSIVLGNAVGIGEAGDVRGSSSVMPSTNSAQTTTGSAIAILTSLVNGLSGGPVNLPVDSIQAGPASGSIIGLGSANEQNSASSVTGEAEALTIAATRGIINLGLSAGLVDQAGSQIVGVSSGTYDTAAATTTGDATDNNSLIDAIALGNVSSIGIRKAPMHLSGNVVAISELVNTVAATIVRGNPLADANSLSLGLDQSPVAIFAGGTIAASASSVASTTAQTVAV